MKGNIKGWPAKGSNKNLHAGLSKIEVIAEDAVDAIRMRAVSKLLLGGDIMDALDRAVLGLMMHNRKIRPWPGNKKGTDALTKLLKKHAAEYNIKL